MQQLDRFTLRTQLGSGGMGTVYCGWDTGLKRSVAIKLMHPHFARQTRFRKQFLNEVQVTANFNHDHIIRVYEGGEIEASGGLYMVMEYVSGGSLSKPLRALSEQGGQLPLREIIILVEQVARALAYAHSHLRIHCDIKPGNILIKRLERRAADGIDWRAVVTDFGLVKATLVETDGLQTQLDGVGTPAYMAPEQAQEHPVSTQSDIYSLGVVLYELLTGTLPLPIQTLRTAVRLHTLGESLTPIHDYNPHIPAALVPIVERALEADLDKRYHSAAKLAADLRTTLNKLTVSEINAFDNFRPTVRLSTLLPADNDCESVSQEDDPYGKTDIDPIPWSPRPDILWPKPENDAISKPDDETGSRDEIHLSLQPTQQLRIHPPDSDELYLQIDNYSATRDRVRLELQGEITRFASLGLDETISLEPHSRQEVEIVFQLDRVCAVEAATYDWVIVAYGQDSEQSLGKVSGSLVVLPVQQAVKISVPSKVKHGKSFAVTLENQGNVAQSFALEGYDTNYSLIYKVPDDPVLLEACATQEVRVVARRENRPIFGQVLPILFRLHAVGDHETYKSSPFSQLQTPPLIAPIHLWLGLILILIVLFYTNWDSITGVVFSPQTPTPEILTATPATPTAIVEESVVQPTQVISDTTPVPSVFEIGRSTRENPIEAYRFGSNDEAANKVVLIGGMRSGFAPASVVIAEQVIEALTADESIIPPNVTVFVIPNMNPDTTANPANPNADRNVNGVDLNSNFDCNWNGEGSAAFSEAETATIRDFLLEHEPSATIFWSFSTTIPRMVTSGQCNSAVSDNTKRLQTLYATTMQFEARDFPSEQGDAVDWAAKVGLPAVFVMLGSNDGQPDVDLHLQAVGKVLDAVANGEFE